MAPASLIEGMEQAVVDAIEIERLDLGTLAQVLVEGGRALHPFAVDFQLCVGVPDERIADPLLQPLRREVVAHVGVAGPRRYAAGARRRRQQRRFADTKAAAGAQYVTSAKHR